MTLSYVAASGVNSWVRSTMATATAVLARRIVFDFLSTARLYPLVGCVES